MISYNFHPSKKARDRYKLEDSLFSLRGTVVFGSLRSAQLLAQAMNESRTPGSPALPLIQPAELYAMGMLHEIFHFVVRQYEKQINPAVLDACLSSLERANGKTPTETLLNSFAAEFPSLSVYRGTETAQEYLAGSSLNEQFETVPHRRVALEEMILLWIEN